MESTGALKKKITDFHEIRGNMENFTKDKASTKKGLQWKLLK